MSGRIIVMRHGRTHSNARGIFDTQLPGAELSVIGRHQVRESGRRLRTLSDNVGYAASSQALRAQQSMLLAVAAYCGDEGEVPQIAQPKMTMTVLPGIHELGAGDLEGRSDDRAHDAYIATLKRWNEGDLHAGMPGGETAQDYLNRATPILEAVAQRCHDTNQDSLMVIHGAAIRILGLHATTLDGDYVRESYIANGSLSIIEPRGAFGTWTCKYFADQPVP
ncbi:phosphoglycerate mutase family protein [Corynebacterium sp. ES2794-CONJ1]|uniref:histidine phosphatase family protein n=1 Tax=unclassified Corynebacterium TaxID=2624378 RepID=UPI00216A8181|nr:MULTISPECIES: histidine phosphatase family protein [unclassified Corynebacterium]MCS4492071.1 phosphoglycerate mutase family protein [Corynebacterium sp. ES2715-CONJ3]MCU9519575.1 phosphoglycerate mutase family protein [Corynebacterium sp. ES2794-CONJ1]